MQPQSLRGQFEWVIRMDIKQEQHLVPSKKPGASALGERRGDEHPLEFEKPLVEMEIRKLMEAAELPALFGIARRVLDELNSRIGHSSLDFDEIAASLCFSRRTLQRRLDSQGVCFSELRDDVRRYHAMHMLIDKKAKVDDIYTALDFSDRSSLNLAFKRWTGSSPRGFVQRYREEKVSESEKGISE